MRRWRLLILGIVALITAASAGAILYASDSSSVTHSVTQSITAFGVCKKVTNSSPTAKTVYVPTQSSAEWASFYSNLPAGVTAASCGPLTTQVILLTSGSSWTVPADWNNSNNSIEVIGGGGGGGNSPGNPSAGGGGAYSKVVNIMLNPGSTTRYAIGFGGGATGAGGDTYFCTGTSSCTWIGDSSVIVGAKGGSGGRSLSGAGGPGGDAGSGIGIVRYSGGTGGSTPTKGWSGGGGGAAGANGNGGNGASHFPGAGGAGGGPYAGSGGRGGYYPTNGSPYGVSGNAYGGAGGSAGGSGATASGGSGAQGIVVITYGP